MSSQRTRIPALRQLIGDACPTDFRHQTSPMSERGITPEDLGTSRARYRPDLVPIVLQAESCPLLRMTRSKVFNGKIRKRGHRQNPPKQ